MEEIFCNGSLSLIRIFDDGNYDLCLNSKPAWLMPAEVAIELADAIYEAEGIDLRADNARLKAENAALRKRIGEPMINIIDEIECANKEIELQEAENEKMLSNYNNLRNAVHNLNAEYWDEDDNDVRLENMKLGCEAILAQFPAISPSTESEESDE